MAEGPAGAFRQGIVALAWPTAGHSLTSLRELLDQARSTPTVLAKIRTDFGVDGPGVQPINPELAVDDDYGVPWRSLVDVLGQPGPYWSPGLRTPALSSPGAPVPRPR